MVCQLPNLRGKARHLQPCSATKRMALMTWRLLTLTLPRWSGRHPSIWRYCSTVISITLSLTSEAGCQLVLTGPSRNHALASAATSIIRRNGELCLVGFEGAAIGAETALMVDEAQPRRVAAARFGWVKDINIGAAVAPVVLAAAARLGTGHDPLALVVGSEEDHHVGDR